LFFSNKHKITIDQQIFVKVYGRVKKNLYTVRAKLTGRPCPANLKIIHYLQKLSMFNMEKVSKIHTVTSSMDFNWYKKTVSILPPQYYGC
jgi:hypothetical protein